jgi:hypothetical protein
MQEKIEKAGCYWMFVGHQNRQNEVEHLAKELLIELDEKKVLTSHLRDFISWFKFYRFGCRMKVKTIIAPAITPPFYIYDPRKIVVSNASRKSKQAKIYETSDGGWCLSSQVGDEIRYDNKWLWFKAYLLAKIFGYHGRYLKKIIKASPFESALPDIVIDLQRVLSSFCIKYDNCDYGGKKKALIFGQPLSEQKKIYFKPTSLDDELDCLREVQQKIKEVLVDYYPHPDENKNKLQLIEGLGINVIDRKDYGPAELYFVATRSRYSYVGSIFSTALFTAYIISDQSYFFYFGSKIAEKNSRIKKYQEL